MSEELQGLPEEALAMGSLILKYLKEEINSEEKLLLDAWITKSEKNKSLFNALGQKEVMNDRLTNYYKGEKRKAAAAEKMMQQVFPDRSLVKRMNGGWRKLYAAAAILLLLAVGMYVWNMRTRSGELAKTGKFQEKYRDDLEPGRNGAILKLANGREIILDSVANGLLAQQGSSNVVKKDGQLAYSGSTSTREQEGISYNTLTTPRGRQFHLVLPDGSQVWLNAESSIHFPVSFTGSERKVEITGEAYFEIEPVTKAGKGKVPFKVLVHSTSATDGMEVEVLGTHFNINAYNDEPLIKTTLLEGSVKVITRQASILIKPGQQALVPGTIRDGITLENPDIEQVMAWKNGTFYFNDVTLEAIMRQLARWYDVEIAYENKKPEMQFVCMISRNTRLSEVLKMLELNGVHFKIEGKKIIVLSQ